MRTESSRRVPEISLLSYLNGEKADRVQFIDQLYFGLKEYGFIILKDHPISQNKVNSFYELVHEFFHLPLETKLKYYNEKGGKQRGYVPFGMEHAKDSTHPDLKEFWHIGRELPAEHKFKRFYPDNVWPTEISEFQQVGTEIYGAMDKTSKALLTAIGTALDLPENYFVDMVSEGNSILRAIHYPSLKGNEEPGSVRAAAHGDINLITMMVGATDSGLELLDRDGQWLPVQSAPGQIVVDTGDMMSRITNEVLPSTIHRVVNPKDSSSTRYSLPFFVHPNPDAMLSCVPSCKGEGAKYEDIYSHNFLMERLEQIGLLSAEERQANSL